MASKSPENHMTDRDGAGTSDDTVEPVADDVASFEWDELEHHRGGDAAGPQLPRPAANERRRARSRSGPWTVAAVAAIAAGGAVWGRC